MRQIITFMTLLTLVALFTPSDAKCQDDGGGVSLLGDSGQAEGGTGETDGQVSGQERFVRENREVGDVVGAAVPTTGFVGQAADGANSAGGGGLGGRGGGGLGGQGFMSLFNAANQMNNLNAGAGQRRLRIPLRLGFAPPRHNPPVTVGRLRSQFSRLPAAVGSGVTVRLEGRTAVLLGRVPTDHAGRLAVQLARLEPGVSDVRNELTVDTAAPAPAGAP